MLCLQHTRPSQRVRFVSRERRRGASRAASAVAKADILIVEDDPHIAELLQFYLSSQGYAVRTTAYGREALALCNESPPDLLLLDVRLPDMSGYDVGRQLRRNPLTRDLPIIVLTAFSERRDRIIALGEIKAQYFVGKPFDIEEVATIIANQLEDARRRSQKHPVTDLPTGELVNQQLRRLLGEPDWTLALIRIGGFETFTQSYGVVVGEEVLKFTALQLAEVVRELGGPGDFVGQMVVGPYFLLISPLQRLRTICERLLARFDAEVDIHYPYQDLKSGRVPALALAVGILCSMDGPFEDMRQLGEAAEDLCQQALRRSRERGNKSAIVSAGC
jgi:DNA-binding response OmpR family regulator